MGILPHAALIKEAFRKKEVFHNITSRADWWENLSLDERRKYLSMSLTVDECYELFGKKRIIFQ